MEETAGSDPNSVASTPDLDNDLLPDVWELAWYPSLASASPLSDSDGDGFNTWAEYRSSTSPVDNASFPRPLNATVRTSDGVGFDGSLCEVNYSGVYDGGFTVNDSAGKRNNCYQNNGVRHYLGVFKFDLSGLPRGAVSASLLNLVVNGSTQGSRTRTLAVFNGDDSQINASIGYNAANPFIDGGRTGVNFFWGPRLRFTGTT
jgi:hypothetical protein